ncbi:hypothetical protein DEAC_c13920 [Desulfosporosinus acididurans]|uniref:PcfK-like protein n=1 Tax=Desulfosporosinus acididurans TaxID=476652 RepID=A0A0J1FTC3_9FIRM|nr:hypothetical protein [Desulfosporosinus acididurans]KLU66724.1 hypothetical protein DEAC_c13920 [Desulfosporosinus acididurans]
MLTKAIEKLQSEMTKNNNNSYIQVVGSFLLQHLNDNPTDAEKIINTDKTVAKSLEEMRKVAEKKKNGNCAVLTDQEGFEVVLKYFGIDAKPTVIVTKPAQNVTEKPKSVTAAADFDIKLEDLL